MAKPSLTIQENVHLGPFTTLEVGGRARFFAKAGNVEQVNEAVNFARSKGTNLFVLGGGSNVLIADRGFDGLVLQIGIKGFEFDPNSSSKLETLNSKLIKVGAGEDWDGFVAYCVENNFAGVECLSGIPGLIGGTPIQNVGAYGQEVSETIESVFCYDREILDCVILTNLDCGFLYRTSIFNSTARERYIVLAVTYKLVVGGVAKVEYPELKRLIPSSQPSLAEVRRQILKIRRSKSMVIDKNDRNSRSAGSFFKNPIVDVTKLEEIRGLFDSVPHFSVGDEFKIPAGWLIEKAGFQRGYALGNAGISANHTLALINRGNATATEIVGLCGQIQKTVDAKFGIRLQPEPVFIGF